LFVYLFFVFFCLFVCLLVRLRFVRSFGCLLACLFWTPLLGGRFLQTRASVPCYLYIAWSNIYPLNPAVWPYIINVYIVHQIKLKNMYSIHCLKNLKSFLGSIELTGRAKLGRQSDFHWRNAWIWSITKLFIIKIIKSTCIWIYC